MTVVDWVAVAVALAAGLTGLRKGFLWSALSTAGLVAGAVAGARLAPLLVPGEESPYAPLAALGGAVVGALVLERLGTLVALRLRGAVEAGPLGVLGAAGGFLVGAASGLFLAWVAGAVVLHLPGRPEVREAVQRSEILARMNEVVPPERVMEALERVDPFPAITGPAPPAQPGDPAVLERPAVEQARGSVVRVVGSACGLAMAGSGWVARPGLVVTNAHVVAGQQNTRVQVTGTAPPLRAQAYAFDTRNDVAVLRVPGLDAPPLPLADATPGRAVAILGFPGTRGLRATAGRIGRTVRTVAPDAYGHSPAPRQVTAFRGQVRRGNSGGPAVNGRGEVETTVFAARVGGAGGFGVPPAIVRRALAGATGPVSTGPCVAPG